MAAPAADEPPTQANFSVCVKVAEATNAETVTSLSAELQSFLEPAQSASEPVETPAAGQSVLFDHTFNLTATANAALEQGLLGAPMRVSVFDRSGGGKVLLSTVEVDLVSFAAGQTLLEVSCPLVPASADVEPKLLPGASATVTVALVSPASLVSPEDIEGGAVVTVTIEGVSTPPPVFAVAPAADQYIFNVALAIGGRTVLFPGGHSAVGATALTWPAAKASKRIFLRATEVRDIRNALRTGASFSAQLGRYLKPEVTGNFDPNYAIYVGGAAADVGALGQPGTTETVADCALRPLEADEQKMLPPPAEGGKPLPENPAPGPDSPWRVAGSRIRFTVSLSKPFYPAWAPPKRPAKIVGDLIPERPAPPPPVETPPEGAYQRECQEVVAILADRYARLVASGKVDPAATPPDELRKEVVFTLTRSGEYLEMKARLAAAVAAVAAARGASGAKPEDKNKLYSDVYADLLDHLHTAVGALNKEPAAAPQGSSDEAGASERATHLLALAREYEAAEDAPAAERCHQERIVVEGDGRALSGASAGPGGGSRKHLAAAYADYGLFLQRTARPGAGQEAMKEALSLDVGNTRALLGLAAGLLEGGAADLSEPFAYELSTAATEFQPGWFLLGEVYAAQGKEAEAFNARFRLSELNGNDASRLVEVASELLEAGAPGLALRACEQAGAAVAARVLASRAHAALKDTAAALEAAAAAIALDRAAGPAHDAAGCAYAAQGDLAQAEESFGLALSFGGGLEAASLRALLLLGRCQQQRGAHDQAAALFLQIGKSRRSTAAWAAAARSLLALSDPLQAEEAAAEANVLDTYHAAPWGLLALAAAAQGRLDEAVTGLYQGLELGFADAKVVADVGAMLARGGQLAEAERVLREALDLGPSPSAAMSLADTLVRSGKLEAARRMYQVVFEDEEATEEERLTARRRSEVLPPPVMVES